VIDAVRILTSCVGFGAGGEAVRRYRSFKQKRRTLTFSERNAGLWTDGRLLAAEIVVFGIVGLFALAVVDFILVFTEMLPIWMLPFPH
jgi:uncharacterized membrane protein YbhN (UPF0104 family)